MEYVFDSKKKKKVNSVPLFFVEHLALTLPCFLYSLPPPPPPNSYTHRHTGSSRSAGYHTSEPFLSSAQRCMLLDIYLLYGVYMSTLLQQADTEGGEREIGRESDRKGVREEEREVE